MPFYKRNLPHLQFRGGEYFVTMRLFGSLPIHVIKDLKMLREQYENRIADGLDRSLRSRIEKLIFLKYETHLDQNSSGPHWLKRFDIAGLVEESIHFRNKKYFDLYAYCIMSNHVHMVFRHIDNDSGENKLNNSSEMEDFPVTIILGDLKKFTARKCNQILKRKGAFWQAESFDRLIRDNSELENCILYTLNNPVKANLVNHWQKWPHTYCKPEFLDSAR